METVRILLLLTISLAVVGFPAAATLTLGSAVAIVTFRSLADNGPVIFSTVGFGGLSPGFVQMNPGQRKALILTGLIFVGLFTINGIFSLASTLGFAPGTPLALGAGAIEIYAIVWIYEKFAHKAI